MVVHPFNGLQTPPGQTAIIMISYWYLRAAHGGPARTFERSVFVHDPRTSGRGPERGHRSDHRPASRGTGHLSLRRRGPVRPPSPPRDDGASLASRHGALRGRALHGPAEPSRGPDPVRLLRGDGA